MQLSGLAVTQSVIIIHPVGNIAALLGLKKQCTALNGMYGTGIDLDKVTGLNGDLTDEFPPSALMDHLLQFFLRLRIVSGYQRSILLAIQDEPALGLTQGSVLMNLRIRIIGMYLDTEIVLRINDLDQQRETIHSRVSEQLRMLLPQLGQFHSLVNSACHSTVSVGMGADTPALTDIVSFDGVPEFSV